MRPRPRPIPQRPSRRRSTADDQAGQPQATATTDPSAIGAGVARVLALELAGQLGSKQVVFPGVLVTQSYLVKEQIKNMADLRAKLPELNLTNVAAAPWIRSATF
jgi:simple sugar transport system substrate-binding protein